MPSPHSEIRVIAATTRSAFQKMGSGMDGAELDFSENHCVLLRI
jgi:hypothetical protein